MKRPLFALLISLASTACEPDLGKVVWVVGDSIAERELPALHSAAGMRTFGDLIMPIAAIPGSALGRDLPYFTRRVLNAGERGVPADAAVVSLGTNDCGDVASFMATWPHVDTESELAAAIDALLGSLPDVPVIWLVPASPLSPPARVAHWRAGLEAATQRWPKLQLLHPEPSWYVGQGEDGVHYSDPGEGFAAREIVARLDALRVQP